MIVQKRALLCLSLFLWCPSSLVTAQFGDRLSIDWIWVGQSPGCEDWRQYGDRPPPRLVSGLVWCQLSPVTTRALEKAAFTVAAILLVAFVYRPSRTLQNELS